MLVYACGRLAYSFFRHSCLCSMHEHAIFLSRKGHDPLVCRREGRQIDLSGCVLEQKTLDNRQFHLTLPTGKVYRLRASTEESSMSWQRYVDASIQNAPEFIRRVAAEPANPSPESLFEAVDQAFSNLASLRPEETLHDGNATPPISEDSIEQFEIDCSQDERNGLAQSQDAIPLRTIELQTATVQPTVQHELENLPENTLAAYLAKVVI